LRLPKLSVEDGNVFIPNEWLEIFQDNRRFQYFKDGAGTFEDCADLAAAGQFCFEQAQSALAEWLHKKTRAEVLCLTGGTALNCVSNGKLLRDSSFKDVFVPPSPHDGGTAMGCAIYGQIEILDTQYDFRRFDDFLAPEPDLSRLVELLTKDGEITLEQPEYLFDSIVELLISGRIIALYYGRSELGPRALGNRSILADPRHPAMKDWINKYVKGRELFRPLAPVALEGAAPVFFEVDRPVPFMQFAVNVRPEYRAVIPAVTHVDGSARLQTVSKRENPFLYALIDAFEKKTRVGVLLNTSFNGQGEPIVETPAEALACFKSTDLHALVIPPFIIRKPIEPGLPERIVLES